MKKIMMTGAILLGVQIASAGQVSSLNSFEAGTPARAAEVNANFSAMRAAINDNHARIAQLEATVAALRQSLTALQGTTVMTLNEHITIKRVDGLPRVVISGINVQIVNGAGQTESSNGLGNLVIGYDEPGDTFVCSVGRNDGMAATSAASGQAVGGIWATSHKNGSHYLVVGPYNNYSRYGGIVAGKRNTANGQNASVLGGLSNIANGTSAIVTGGFGGVAGGLHSSVSGGRDNTASASYSSVSGGRGNTARGFYSSVSGGLNRAAGGDNSWAAGGLLENQ